MKIVAAGFVQIGILGLGLWLLRGWFGRFLERGGRTGHRVTSEEAQRTIAVCATVSVVAGTCAVLYGLVVMLV